MHDEVRFGLGHSAQVRDVMPHDHIAQCEVSSGAEGQVADNEPHWWGQVGRQRPNLLSDDHPSRQPVPTHSLTRCASMLVDNQQVSDTIGFAGSHQCPYLMPATVHALGAWEHQLQLLYMNALQLGLGPPVP